MADPFIRYFNGKLPGHALIIMICACLVWGLLPAEFSTQFSDRMSKGGQDDFFKPYFMRKDFDPAGTVRKSVELAGEKTEGFAFVDFSADYPSIIFYGRLLKVDDSFWVFDKPNSKVNTLGDLGSIHVITLGDSRMESIAERFNMKSYELAADCGYQKIYLARLK